MLVQGVLLKHTHSYDIVNEGSSLQKEGFGIKTAGCLEQPATHQCFHIRHDCRLATEVSDGHSSSSTFLKVTLFFVFEILITNDFLEGTNGRKLKKK